MTLPGAGRCTLNNRSVKRQTLTLSSYVVVIVDGDGDVAVDDCSACQMQLLPESPCSYRAGRCRTYLGHRSRVCDGVRGCAGRVVRAEGCRCHDKAARRRPPRTYRRDAHAIVLVI